MKGKGISKLYYLYETLIIIQIVIGISHKLYLSTIIYGNIII